MTQACRLTTAAKTTIRISWGAQRHAHAWRAAHRYRQHRTRCETLPPDCWRTKHSRNALVSAWGQILNTHSPNFHPSLHLIKPPHPPSTPNFSSSLLKMGQSSLPEADREPGGATKLLSPSQQQLRQEFQRQIGFSNKPPSLSSLRHPLNVPLCC